MPSLSDHVVFNNGKKMPTMGLGTWLGNPGEVEGAVEEALKMGYRHIDTAFMYRNEAAIGTVLKKWISSGKVKREELFIVTKLPLIGMTREGPTTFLDKSLKALGLDYVDLYLIHTPIGVHYHDDENQFPLNEEKNLDLDMDTDLVAVWKGMEEQVKKGKAKSIGLSNFNEDQIQRILDKADIPPVNLQVEIHAYFQQKGLRKYCRNHNITVCAYAPLGSPGRDAFYKALGQDTPPLPKLLDNEIVVKIAEKHHVTPAQVLLRHLAQDGLVVIPKSVNQARVQLNYQIFNFELTDAEMKQLDSLDQGPAGRSFRMDFPGIEKHPEYYFNKE